MDRKLLVVTMLILLVVVAITLGYSWYQSNSYNFSGSLITPAKPAPTFTLTSQDGNQVSLADFQGKYVLVFFGYTNCPSECPLTMGYLKHVHDRLGAQAELMQVVLVTTDPDHDTPQVLGEYLDHFDPSFIGLTGSVDNLQPVWSSYGVTVMAGGETHSSYLYMIDPQGNLIATYPLLTTPDGITADLQHLISQQ